MSAIEITRSHNNNLTRVYVGDVVIWFSYETPVAYSIPGEAGVVVSDEEWSVTTNRHINTIQGRRAPVPHEEFVAGLEKIAESVSAGLKMVTGTAEAPKPSEGLVRALDAFADALYEERASAETFAALFSRSELEILAGLCQITAEQPGRSYDDEVFDALAMLS